MFDIFAYCDDVHCLIKPHDVLLFQTREERRWFGERFEQLHGEELTVDEKISIATLMLRAQVMFERHCPTYLQYEVSLKKNYRGLEETEYY